VPQELLEHPPVEQELRHSVAQQMGVDPLLDARLPGGGPNQLLDGPWGVVIVTVGLEEVAPRPARQVQAQLLGQGGQRGHVARCRNELRDLASHALQARSICSPESSLQAALKRAKALADALYSVLQR